MRYTETDPAKRKADADRLCQGIARAIETHDIEAVPHMIRVLCMVDPHRAADVYDTLRLGLALAAAGTAVPTEEEQRG